MELQLLPPEGDALASWACLGNLVSQHAVSCDANVELQRQTLHRLPELK